MSIGGSRAWRPRARTDLPVPRPPAITTPPRPGSTAAKSRASFRVPWPVMAARGKARAAIPLATMETLENFVVGASLADQGLAIGLGANLPSAAGGPIETLIALRPELQVCLGEVELRWSPLFRTAPVGGPPDQPDYINAVVVLDQPPEPTPAAAMELLRKLQALECQFGRVRQERWGPRTLDLDLLWWRGFQLKSLELELPHPRWEERPFVLAPLCALDASFEPQLEKILARYQHLPLPLRPRPGWAD